MLQSGSASFVRALAPSRVFVNVDFPEAPALLVLSVPGLLPRDECTALFLGARTRFVSKQALCAFFANLIETSKAKCVHWPAELRDWWFQIAARDQEDGGGRWTQWAAVPALPMLPRGISGFDLTVHGLFHVFLFLTGRVVNGSHVRSDALCPDRDLFRRFMAWYSGDLNITDVPKRADPVLHGFWTEACASDHPLSMAHVEDESAFGFFHFALGYGKIWHEKVIRAMSAIAQFGYEKFRALWKVGPPDAVSPFRMKCEIMSLNKAKRGLHLFPEFVGFLRNKEPKTVLVLTGNRDEIVHAPLVYAHLFRAVDEWIGCTEVEFERSAKILDVSTGRVPQLVVALPEGWAFMWALGDVRQGFYLS